MLELEHISFEVAGERGEKEILKDVSFVLPDNKFVVITGPNGGGKSTLAKAVSYTHLDVYKRQGLENPDSGQVLLEGKDVTNLEPNCRDVNTEMCIRDTKYGKANKIASSEDKTFSYIPDCSDLPISEDADYVYICENNTIYGTKYKTLPRCV